jgi:hypothetical protein
MDEPIYIYKNRTNVLTESLGIDVSADTFTSEIRERKSVTSLLIATLTVTFADDGTDGELILTCPSTEVDSVTQRHGYIDIKRVSDGEPLALFAPKKVIFVDTVTA